MSHPADADLAVALRATRLAASRDAYPARTRPLGRHSLRQCSAGRLAVEVARCDRGLREDVADARRQALAAELERREFVEAAEQARRRAEEDRDRAERERMDAEARSRSGDLDDGVVPLVLAVAAAGLFGRETEVAALVDEELHSIPGQTADARAALDGEPSVGLTPDELREELAEAGAPTSTVDAAPTFGPQDTVAGELISRAESPAPDPTPAPVDAPTPEASPEVG